MSLNDEPDDNNHIFYDPITILRPLSRATNIPLDQLNFVTCLFLSFPLGFWFRVQLKNADRNTRAMISAVIGMVMCYFCYGRAIIHLFLNAYGSYCLIYLLPPKIVHRAVFIFSMSYLLLIHSYRWMYQKSYCLDVTGSIMVAVGKVTLLATGVHDGMGRNRKELTESQARDAIEKIPSILDFTSYMFNFQTVIVGPMNHYSAWSSFLDRTHVPIDQKTGKLYDPSSVAIRKFEIAVLFSVAYSVLGPFLPMSITSDPEYNKLNIIHWWFWHMIASTVHRLPYYYAWIITDSVCNISGFGFDGIDTTTSEAKWSRTTNVRPLKVELGQNYKEMVDNWNIWTVAWLRRVVYERVHEDYRTLAVYATGAAWHGLAFGYYISFLTSALFTLSAAMFRRCVRHHFLSNPTLKKGYDVFGIICSKFAIGYVHYPFYTMHFGPSLFMYRKLYMSPHLIALFCLYALPHILPPIVKSKSITSEKLVSEKTSETRTMRDQKSEKDQSSTRTARNITQRLSIKG